MCVPSDANWVQRQIRMNELKQVFTAPSCIPVPVVSLGIIRKIYLLRGVAAAFCSELFQSFMLSGCPWRSAVNRKNMFRFSRPTLYIYGQYELALLLIL